MSEHGSGVGAFLMGVVVGAVVGVLFAPAKGEVTRRRIGRRAEELRDLAQEKADELAGILAGEGAPAEADDEDEGEDEPTSRGALERRLRDARHRRRAERAARGRALPSEEGDEPVA